jgi:hypothetical protein
VLKCREEELAKKIHGGADAKELLETAEKVREAQLAYLKGKKYYLLDPKESELPVELKHVRRSWGNLEGDNEIKYDSATLAKTEADLNDWKDKAGAEIVELYQRLKTYQPPEES